MAQRSWLVRPDHQVQTVVDDSAGSLVNGPPIAAVSQEALAKAVVDGVILLDRAGGVLAVTVGRAPTGVPGERVTTGAMVEWKDRTDARPQPERAGPAIPLHAIEDIPESEEEKAALEAALDLPMDASEIVGTDALGNEVDERDVPVELRGA